MATTRKLAKKLHYGKYKGKLELVLFLSHFPKFIDLEADPRHSGENPYYIAVTSGTYGASLIKRASIRIRKGYLDINDFVPQSFAEIFNTYLYRTDKPGRLISSRNFFRHMINENHEPLKQMLDDESWRKNLLLFVEKTSKRVLEFIAEKNKEDDIMFRAECTTFSIYSNDVDGLDTLSNDLEGYAKEHYFEGFVFSPDYNTLYVAPDIVCDSPDAILMGDKYASTYSHKIILNDMISNDFCEWIKREKENGEIMATPTAYTEFKSAYGYTKRVENKTYISSGRFFYSKSEDMTDVILLLFGDDIKKLYRIENSDLLDIQTAI